MDNVEGETFWSNFKIPLIVFFLALIPRIFYIFALSNPNFPGWYTDVFHHWQIAYLSKEIGFHQGFLRLWDFKGMEFFWGLLHPLVLSFLFWITGSISIILPRLLSTVGGSISIVLLFLLVRRYFNEKAAWAVAIFATFFPITLFSNSVGMQEELAMPFILGGLLLWPKKPFLTGIFFALASMVRAEYWLFALGLILAAIILRKHMDKVVVMFVSYFLPIFMYMKYLANYTGSYIYPIYWNFLASVKGEWFRNLPIVGEKLVAQWISRGIFTFGIIGVIITFVKRPKHALFFLFGFGNIIFIGFMVGFGSYVKGYIPRYWVDRLYNWPYLFVAILIILSLFYYLPKIWHGLDKFKINWLIFSLTLVASQLIWLPINFSMKPVREIYDGEKTQASQIAQVYKGDRILLPEDRPFLTYFLAHDYKILGKNMVGEMFDPYYYFKDKTKPETVIKWLKDNNVKLIVLTTAKPTYMGLFKMKPELFTKLPSKDILLYKVEAY